MENKIKSIKELLREYNGKLVSFVAMRNGKDIPISEARVYIDSDSKVYLLQNEMCGCVPFTSEWNTFGYKFSWTISKISTSYLDGGSKDVCIMHNYETVNDYNI